ncbi:MAG TPA: hypothetical protein VEW71_06550 [Allosphingosinicella sp.]|nr:hypothetical protein [Allosphingosinicella sp.]
MATKAQLRTAFDSLVTALSQAQFADQPPPIPGRRAGLAARAAQIAQGFGGLPASSPGYQAKINLLDAARAALQGATLSSTASVTGALDRVEQALNSM